MNDPEQFPGSDELHWLAFRYATGELNAEEEAAFEERLAEDQAAREALAQAVELHQALLFIAADQSAHRQPVRRVAIWVAALAACLLAAIGLTWLAASRWTHTPGPQDPLVAADAQAAEVARAYGAIRQQLERDALVAEPAPRLAQETGVDDETLTTEPSVPSWMLTAVSAPEKK